MPVSTGAQVLDRMLNGGYPEGRAVAVSGTPGTGKSTLAMQFLQAGVEAGESCVFLSSEQDIEGIHNSFGSFEFDLEHDDLRIVSLQTGRSSDTDEGGSDRVAVVDEGGGRVNMEAFTDERIRTELDRYGPFDRVVVDSVSGLEHAVPDRDGFRDATLDLIEVLTSDFGATTVLTSEYTSAGTQGAQVENVALEDVVQYTVDGVIRLWRERRRGEYRRFADVMKMRGVKHDVRQYELEISDAGVKFQPRHRAFPQWITDGNDQPTGVDGLDELLSGGLPKGDSTLLQHDGTANVNELILIAGLRAVSDGLTLVMIPRANATPRQLDRFLGSTAFAFDDSTAMLDAGALVVIDPLDAWPEHESVIKHEGTGAELRESLREIRDRNADGGLFLALNTEVKAHTMSTSEVRRFRYWVPSQFLAEQDLLLDIHNPATMKDELAELYSDAATVSLETWVDEVGLQYLRLEKANAGDIGSVNLVSFVEEEPYIELQR